MNFFVGSTPEIDFYLFAVALKNGRDGFRYRQHFPLRAPCQTSSLCNFSIHGGSFHTSSIHRFSNYGNQSAPCHTSNISRSPHPTHGNRIYISGSLHILGLLSAFSVVNRSLHRKAPGCSVPGSPYIRRHTKKVCVLSLL